MVTLAFLCFIAKACSLAVLAFSSASDWPMTTALASACCFRSKATWSRQALASLSTRVGRLVSVAKLIEHSACVFGAGGTYGAVIVKLVDEFTECPLSSDTLHVIPTAPVGAPAEEYSAVVPLPVTVPAVAE